MTMNILQSNDNEYCDRRDGNSSDGLLTGVYGRRHWYQAYGRRRRDPWLQKNRPGTFISIHACNRKGGRPFEAIGKYFYGISDTFSIYTSQTPCSVWKAADINHIYQGYDTRRTEPWVQDDVSVMAITTYTSQIRTYGRCYSYPILLYDTRRTNSRPEDRAVSDIYP